MIDFSFLTVDQILGENKLDILKRYGIKCAITDFAILLGGSVSSDCYTSEGNRKKDRTGWWWTKTFDECVPACAVDFDGRVIRLDPFLRSGGARPVLPYSSIFNISLNGVIGSSGIEEIEYGEYPQTIVDEIYSLEIERAYDNGKLITTGKEYTTDSVDHDDSHINFRDRTHIEYEYNGNKYIRFIGDSNCSGQILSDGRKIESGDIYWVSVEPITWLVDKKADILLSKKILFAGVQFKNRLVCQCDLNTALKKFFFVGTRFKDSVYDQGDFNTTDIKQFMDNCFSKEIVSSNVKTELTETINNEKLIELLNEEKQLITKLIKVSKEHNKILQRILEIEELKKTYLNTLEKGFQKKLR